MADEWVAPNELVDSAWQIVPGVGQPEVRRILQHAVRSGALIPAERLQRVGWFSETMEADPCLSGIAVDNQKHDDIVSDSLPVYVIREGQQ